MITPALKTSLRTGAVLLAVAAAGLAWHVLKADTANAGLATGNGRIEATEVDVATKLPGRIEAILVGEGDLVAAGQPLARMQVQSLQAQRDEADAGRQRALQAVSGAQAEVALRQANVTAVLAQVAQREAELDATQRRLARSEALSQEGASSVQELDDDRARMRSAQAALAASRAQADAARAAVVAAQAQVAAALSAVSATDATLARIGVDIQDAVLTAPRAGRVQFRLAQPGEVLGGGGKLLNLVDLSDVYLTFFLPEAQAGRVALGAEVHLRLDAAPQYVIPARVSFVAGNAQFTPKTVETASERQKLMFRIKAQIDPALLQQHLQQVKTGLPGVAAVRLDASQPWPAAWAVKLPQ